MEGCDGPENRSMALSVSEGSVWSPALLTCELILKNDAPYQTDWIVPFIFSAFQIEDLIGLETHFEIF